MKYLEKLRPVERWENLLSLITSASKLRGREIFFADIVSQCLYSRSGFSWRYFALVRRRTTVVGSLEKPEEERRAAMEI